jgi:hypothetical protein
MRVCQFRHFGTERVQRGTGLMNGNYFEQERARQTGSVTILSYSAARREPGFALDRQQLLVLQRHPPVSTRAPRAQAPIFCQEYSSQ